MKNRKNLQIGRNVPRIEVARPGHYVCERPERIRGSFSERLVNAFKYYRPDIEVRIKSPGIAFGDYAIRILDGEAHFSGEIHPFKNTTELLEDLVENNIVNLTKSDVMYIARKTDKS